MQANTPQLNVLARCATYFALLQGLGYEVNSPRDFNSINRMVAQTGRKKQTPMMSISRNDFAQGDAFWLFLLKDGVAVACASARQVNLGDERADSYLRRTFSAQYENENQIGKIALPVSEELTGRLIYFGELEFHPDHRKQPGVLSAFVRILQAEAFSFWPNFDTIFAFVPKEHVRLMWNYGFTTYVPSAVEWNDPVPNGRRSDHCLVTTKRSHFINLWSIDDQLGLERKVVLSEPD